MSFDLPIAPSEPGSLTERADAARNRRRILAATAALVAERGIGQVSMQDVAQAACVGTGTLYRRFGDRAGLALALLDQETRDLQDAIMLGPPPLGPGAPAADRLRAFGLAMLDHLERQAEVVAAATKPERNASGPEALFLTHLVILLRAAAPDRDPEYTARALFGILDARQHLHARRGLGWSLERLKDGWLAIVGDVTAGVA